MHREATVTVVGWVDPVTGEKTRRGENAVKLWRYINAKFAREGEIPVIHFAVPGVMTSGEALYIGYEIMVARLNTDPEIPAGA